MKDHDLTTVPEPIVVSPSPPKNGKRAATRVHPTDNLLKRVWAVPASRAVLALALVVALGCIFHADGAFYKLGTHRDALRQASVFGLLACGMTLVIVSAGIDLAVGSVL